MYRDVCRVLTELATTPNEIRPTTQRTTLEVASAVLEQDQVLMHAPELRTRVERLAHGSDRNSATSDPRQLAVVFNELRFFLLAVALTAEGVGATPEQPQTLANILKGDELPTIAGIEKLPSGLVHGVFRSTRIVTLPAILTFQPGDGNDEEFHRIYHEFSAIEELERAHTPHHWVLDLSLVQHIPLLLFANIIAYSQRLRQVGRQMLLFSVRKELFSAQQLSRVREHFRLHDIGGLLYSLTSTS